MDVKDRVIARISEIARCAEAGPDPELYITHAECFDDLLRKLPAPCVPARLLAPPRSTIDDYRANWNHQLWYHCTELVRIVEGRKDRAKAQGGDAWVNAPKPPDVQELQSHVNEIAKLRALLTNPPQLVYPTPATPLVRDDRLDAPDAWEIPDGLEVQRDAEMGVCWQGRSPGGDWFWLRQPLGDGPVSIRFELYPVSTLVGGLITAFCARPRDPRTPLRVASSPKMSDYYANFDAYHFSVNRGASGYCNLRRCGPGLLMLTSFHDPCPDYGKWYGIEVIKDGPQVELRVDGALVACYIDLGFIQPALAGGFLGLRHFQGFRGWHRNVRICGLAT